MDVDPVAGRVADLRFEHDLLRTEILHNDTVSAQLLVATITITGAAYAFGGASAAGDQRLKGVIFLVAAAIALIGMSQSLDRSRLTFLIAAYLRVFTEARLRDVRWETRVAMKRELDRERTGVGSGFNVTSVIHERHAVYLVIWFMSFVTGAYYVVWSMPPIWRAATPGTVFANGVVASCICTVAIALYALLARAIHHKYVDVLTYGRPYAESWLAIKEAELSRSRAAFSQPEASRQPTATTAAPADRDPLSPSTPLRGGRC